MKKLFFLALVLLVVPLVPFKTAHAADSVVADAPAWIYAPSISLFSPIQGVGTTAAGEMAVPSGYSNNVGWYAPGILPGETGTAVLDAHVFAAFKNLSLIKPGQDIYIVMQSGKLLHFVTTAAQTYALNSLSPYTLFAPTSAKQLNLITCAGNLTANGATYDHRLIVSAVLI